MQLLERHSPQTFLLQEQQLLMEMSSEASARRRSVRGDVGKEPLSKVRHRRTSPIPLGLHVAHLSLFVQQSLPTMLYD